MSNFTPGPWHWDSDPVKGDPYGRVRYRVTALGKTITQVYHSSYDGGQTNAEWDARLIAAAPDLLAALKTISDQSAFEIALDPDWPRRIAEEAISKALGMSSPSQLHQAPQK